MAERLIIAKYRCVPKIASLEARKRNSRETHEDRLHAGLLLCLALAAPVFMLAPWLRFWPRGELYIDY